MFSRNFFGSLRFIAPILLILFINNFISILVLPTFLNILDINLNINPYIKASFIGMLSPVYLLAVPIIGSQSDKWGRKKVVGACLLITILGCCILFLACLLKSVTLVLLAIVLLDLTSGLVAVMQAFVADFSVGTQRAYFLALIYFSKISRTPAEWVVNIIPWLKINNNVVIITVLGLALLNMLICLKWLPNSRSVLNIDGKKMATTLEEIVNGFFMIFADSRMRIIVLFFLLFSASSILFTQDYVYYLEHFLDLNSLQIQNFFIYKEIIKFLSLVIIFPIIIYFFPVYKIFITCLLMFFIGISLDSVSPSYLLKWGTDFCIMFGGSVLYALLWKFIADEADKNHRGMIMGVIYVLWNFLWILSEIIVDFLNHYSASAAPLLVTFLTVLLLILYVNKHVRRIFSGLFLQEA